MRHITTLSMLCAAAGVLLLAMPLAAAPEQATSKPATAQSDVALSTLALTLDQGKPLTLDGAAASVFVANPDIADVQVLAPNKLMVFGKKMGQTTLMATDDQGRTLIHRTVVVSQNLADLRTALRIMVPGNTIQVSPVPNGIIMTGWARDPSIVEDARRLALRFLPEKGEIINRVRVEGSNQINIRVRFAEVSRDIDKRFGINWESIGSVGDFAFGLATGAPVISAGANLLDRNRPNIGNNTNNIISGSVNSGRYNINGVIDALARDGLITILAEPNLTAMSGQTASFLAGGEYPIPVPQSLTTIGIEFKEYGVMLAFTPTIIGENRINLHVRPEVSQLSSAGAIVLQNISIPALTTRRAETTIEVASGQSFAIAGLLNSNQNQNVDKYPFLGDLPVLGPLFRSTRFQNNETELVIIITPYVVHGAAPDTMALATDGYSAPSDVDRIFRLRQTNSNSTARTLSGEPPAVLDTAPTPPAPAPAPIEPVTQQPILPSRSERPPEPATASPIASSRTLPTKTFHARSLAPAGQGGFIVE